MYIQKSLFNFILLSLVGTIEVINFSQLPTFAQLIPVDVGKPDSTGGAGSREHNQSIPDNPQNSSGGNNGQIIRHRNRRNLLRDNPRNTNFRKPSRTLIFQPINSEQSPSNIKRRLPGDISACLKDEKHNIIPLVPTKNLALTVEKYPTFFWFIPESKAKKVNFTLLNQDNQVIYENSLDIPIKQGIVSFTIPKTVTQPLNVNTIYHWSVELLCNDKNSKNNPYVETWLKRIEAPQDLLDQLKKATPSDIPFIYAQAGIWQETLTTLVNLHQANPSEPEFNKDWEKLLNSVGLQDVSAQPLVY